MIIKSVTKGPWGKQTPTHNTWYEPFEDQTDIDLAVHWVLKRPGVFLNTAGDIHLLPKVLDAANRFEEGPTEQKMAEEATRLEMAPLFV